MTKLVKGNKDLVVKMIVSRPLDSDSGEFIVSNDGRYLTTYCSKNITIWYSSSLEVHRTIQLICSAFLIQFSPNSEILSFITKNPYRLNLYSIEEDHIVEIDLDADLEIVKVIWSPSGRAVAFCSELGVYTGIYDTVKHDQFNLEGCSQTDCKTCLIDFSPQSDYLCLASGFHVAVYDTVSWSEVRFKSLVYPTLLKCSNAYSVITANNEGILRVYSLFGQIALDEKFHPTSCVKSACFSSDWVSLFVATYDNKILIYDAICWRKTAEINILSYFEERFFKSYQIERGANFVDLGPVVKTGFCTQMEQEFKSIKNTPDVLKIKMISPFKIVPCPDGQYIATYNPGIQPSSTVWIWRLTNTRYLDSVISLKSTKITGLRWHHKYPVLAVVSDSETVLWEPSMDKLIALKIPRVRFQWVKSRRKIGIVSTDNAGWLVYFT